MNYLEKTDVTIAASLLCFLKSTFLNSFSIIKNIYIYIGRVKTPFFSSSF